MTNCINDSQENNELNINNLNNDFEEEKEELEDQKRRNAELHGLLEDAFTDITNEISDDESDYQNSVENMTVDIDNNPSEFLTGTSSNETINCMVNKQVLDDLYSKYQSNELSISDDVSYSPVVNQSSFSNQSRRRQYSFHRISQLSPLKEVDISCQNDTNDDSISQEQSDILELVKSDTSNNVISENILCHCTRTDVENLRVQELKKLTERVKELENELEHIKEDHNKVIKFKNNELQQVNTCLKNNQKLVAETQIKVKQYENEIRALKFNQEKIEKQKESLQCELKTTQIKSADLEKQLVQLKNELENNSQKIKQFKESEQKFQHQITALNKIIQEKNEINCDLEKGICELKLSYNNILTERNEIYARLNENCTKLAETKDENKKNNEQLEKTITENGNLKKMNQELLEKLAKLMPELKKIITFKLDENEIVNFEVNIIIEKLQTKWQEILNMKNKLEKQDQIIKQFEKNHCKKEMSTCFIQTDEYYYVDVRKKDEQIRQYKELIKILKIKLDDFVKTATVQQSNYNQLKDDHNELSIDYLKRGNRIEELECHVKTLESKIEEMEIKELNEKFQAQLRVVIDKYEQLKKSFTEINQELQATNKENAILKTTLIQNNEQIAFLKNHIEIYEENSVTFQELLHSLKVRLKEADDRTKGMCNVEEENNLLKEKLKDLKCAYALARKEMEQMCANVQLVNEKDQLIEKINELMLQEQKLKVKIKSKMEELCTIRKKIQDIQIECSTNSNNNISALVTRISDMQIEIKQLLQERNRLQETIIQLNEKDVERTREIEQFKFILKQANEENERLENVIDDLQRKINNQNNISEQLKHLEEMVTERLERIPPIQDANVQVSPHSQSIDEKLAAVENAYQFKLQSLQKSFKEIMCRNCELQNDYDEKIRKLETEKKYLEQCIQSMDQCANETIKGINLEKEAIKNMLNKVLTKLSTFDRREADWKQRQEILEKEKQILQRGIDKFARTMLEFHLKYQKMRANIKRIKDEKWTYYEYVRLLKKKMSRERGGRSLSESSLVLSDNFDELLVVPEIQTKMNSDKTVPKNELTKQIATTTVKRKARLVDR